MTLYKEQEQACRQLGNAEALAGSLVGQVMILTQLGRADQGFPLVEEAYQLATRHGHMTLAKRIEPIRTGVYLELVETANELGDEAKRLLAQKQFEEAMHLFKKEEELWRQVGDKAGLANSINNQGEVLRMQGHIEEALFLYRQSESIFREVGDETGLPIPLANQAEVLAQHMGRAQEALPLAEEAYRLAKAQGLGDLAEQIEPILSAVRQMVRGESGAS